MKQKVSGRGLLFMGGLMLMLMVGLWSTSCSGPNSVSAVPAQNAPQTTTTEGNKPGTVVPFKMTRDVKPTSSGSGASTTGSGASGQVAFWTGAGALSGDNSLSWDNTNKRLGVGTQNPTAKLQVLTGANGEAAVHAQSTNGYGVEGDSSTELGVYGISYSTIPSSAGVYGQCDANNTYGVFGTSNAGSAIYGVTVKGLAGQFEGNVKVVGNLSVSGTKNFVAQDPTDPTKEIDYACLEGPEAGTYIRGSAELVDGQAIIQLPDHFAKVTVDKGLTVELTPVGKWLQLYVVEKGTDRIVVREATGQDGNFDYLIQGIRQGFEDFQVMADCDSTPGK